MRQLLTTLAAAGLVMGVGLEVAPVPAQAALPQLNSTNNQASPIEKAGYWYGYRRYGYYPYRGTIGVPGIIGATPTAITGRIAMAIGGGPIIAVTGSLIWIDQDRSASRRS